MEIIIFLLFVIVILLAFLAPNLENKSGKRVIEKISDEKVSSAIVIQFLTGWKPTVQKGRKNGFTEKDVHDELEIYLKKHFYSVTREYAIEGKNVKRIDFDLGNGRVGVEIKLAEKLLKEGESDRIIGQLIKYTSRKYNNENLIIAVAGFKEHERHTVIHETKEFVEANTAHFIFLRAKK